MPEFTYLCTFPITDQPDGTWEIAELDVRATITMSGDGWSLAGLEIRGMRRAANGRIEDRWIDLQPGTPRHTEIKAWLEATRGDDIQAAWLDEDVIDIRAAWSDEH